MERTEPATLALSEQSQRYLTKLARVWPQFPSVEQVVLFGSRAKGTHRPASDMDLYLTAPELTHSEWVQLDDAIDDLYLPITVDLLRAEEVRHAGLLEHIARVGITIYERTLPKETDL